MVNPANGALALALGTALMLTACPDDLARSRDILFVATRPGGTEDTYALHLADLTTRRLIKADSATSRSTAEFPDHRADVYVIHNDGSRLRAVLQDSTNYRCPSWAPDGRRFAVSAWRAGRSAIRAVEVESGAVQTLLASDTSYLDCPQWSPNDDAIVLTIIPGNTDMWKRDPLEPWRTDLGTLDLKSGQLTLLVGGPGLNNYGRWSRDGRWIVFQSNRHAAPRIDSLPLRDRFRSLEIYIVRPDGSDLRRLTTNEYYDGHPSW